MTSRKGIVTLDGPGGSGKSTLAKRVADRLGWNYLDSGALYRAVAALLLDRKIEPVSGPRLQAALHALPFDVQGREGRWIPVSEGVDLSPRLRDPRVGEAASRFSALPQVRAFLLHVQHQTAEKGALVCDGRDMGSVVFPEARYKFFLEASPEVRARRRFDELKARFPELSYEAVLRELKERDDRDTGRAHSPLVIPPGAQVVDTTGKTISEVLEILLNFIDKGNGPPL